MTSTLPPASRSRSRIVSRPIRRWRRLRSSAAATSNPRPSSVTWPYRRPSCSCRTISSADRAGVLADVHDRLAHRAVGDLLDDIRVARVRDRDRRRERGLLAGLLGQIPQRAGEALLLEAGRAQLEHQPPGAVGGRGQRAPGSADDRRDALAVGRLDRLPQPVERDQARGQHLHRVVVQLGRHPPPLLLLGPQQALDGVPALALAAAHARLEPAAALLQTRDLAVALDGRRRARPGGFVNARCHAG